MEETTLGYGSRAICIVLLISLFSLAGFGGYGMMGMMGGGYGFGAMFFGWLTWI
jgi:hypothetical protein